MLLYLKCNINIQVVIMIKIIKNIENQDDRIFSVTTSAKQRNRNKKRERRAEKIRKESAERDKNSIRVADILQRITSKPIRMVMPNVNREDLGFKSGVVVATGDRHTLIKINIDKDEFIKVMSTYIIEAYAPTAGDQVKFNVVKVTYPNDNVKYDIKSDTFVELVMSNEEYMKNTRIERIHNFLNNYTNVVIATKKGEETTNGGTSITQFEMEHRFKTMLNKKSVVTVMSRFVRDSESDIYIIKLDTRRNTRRGIKAFGITSEEKTDIIAEYRNMCRTLSQKSDSAAVKSNDISKKLTMSDYAAAFGDDSDSD